MWCGSLYVECSTDLKLTSHGCAHHHGESANHTEVSAVVVPCWESLLDQSRHWLSSHQGLLVCYLSPSTTKCLLKYGCAHHHCNHTEVSALVVPCWESLLDRRRHWLSSQQGLLDWLDTCYLSPSTTQHLLKYLRICLSWSWEHKTVTFLNTYMSQ